MSVYVDRLRSCDSRTKLKRWCKLWADTIGERHEIAAKLGLTVDTFFTTNGFFFYEITPAQRERAIANGALMWTVREWKFEQKGPRR